jgi:hypothetical protein
MADNFGDLREWGRVLKEIELLGLAGQLDEHEEGLTRVLRYPYNWQLRQAALKAVSLLKRPSKDLFNVLIGIVKDDYGEMETRLLACNAVRDLIRKETGDLGSEAARRANEILRVPQPPVLRKAVERWLAHKPAEQATGT